jgi:hypothetical protein
MASGNQSIRQPHIISDDDDKEEEGEASIAASSTTTHDAEDRAFLNRAAKSIDTWQTFWKCEVQMQSTAPDVA